MKDAPIGSNVDLGDQGALSPPKAVKILKVLPAAVDAWRKVRQVTVKQLGEENKKLVC